MLKFKIRVKSKTVFNQKENETGNNTDDIQVFFRFFFFLTTAALCKKS